MRLLHTNFNPKLLDNSILKKLQQQAERGTFKSVYIPSNYSFDGIYQIVKGISEGINSSFY